MAVLANDFATARLVDLPRIHPSIPGKIWMGQGFQADGTLFVGWRLLEEVKVGQWLTADFEGGIVLLLGFDWVTHVLVRCPVLALAPAAAVFDQFAAGAGLERAAVLATLAAGSAGAHDRWARDVCSCSVRVQTVIFALMFMLR